MMHRAAFLATLSLLLASTLAQAQQEPDTDAFNGKWNVRIDAGSGHARTATLTLVNWAGTWVATSLPNGPRSKVCIGRKLPVTVQVSQAATLEFTAWGAQIATACPDLNMVLRPVSEKVLEGSLSTGETVTLTRRPR
ncbi:hypothetical protein [Pelomonas sp. KK5]|uniref:hypothetical protein n=1 Tax=Pelomonas sp. KK5 TaxID=1855730 RepID=UPI00097BE110|nr:hypothetical protein [Pelomonas sp. KK5]